MWLFLPATRDFASCRSHTCSNVSHEILEIDSTGVDSLWAEVGLALSPWLRAVPCRASRVT